MDLSDGSDCSEYKFICAEIRKDDPEPDFELLEASRFARRGCAQVTCTGMITTVLMLELSREQEEY